MSLTITFLQSCKLSDEIHSKEGCNGNQMIKLTLNDYITKTIIQCQYLCANVTVIFTYTTIDMQHIHFCYSLSLAFMHDSILIYKIQEQLL